jgi:hypothetical protein
MSNTALDRAFLAMIMEHRIHQKLDITTNHVKQLRHQLRTGKPISTEKKARLLRKTGWLPEDHPYTRQDVLEAVKFAINQGGTAKTFGPAYIVEKWENSRG